MRRAIGLLRGLIPLALAIFAGVALAQPANVSEAEDSIPTIHPIGSVVDVIAVPAGSPATYDAVDLAYKQAAAPKPSATKAPDPKSTTSAKAPAKAPAAPADEKAATPSNDRGAFSITCYSINGGTASGQRTGPGVAAADSSVFPLGTKIHIDGIGDYTVLDRGPRGRTVDIWMPVLNDCRAFGRKTRNVSVIS